MIWEAAHHSDDDDNGNIQIWWDVLTSLIAEWTASWSGHLGIRSTCHLITLFSGVVNHNLLISVYDTEPIFFKIFECFRKYILICQSI